jgi:GTP-binding protein
MSITRNDLRNIAIIAHVDHGKTTLVDGMLRQAKVFRENQKVAERVMDSNDLERERGITILAKNTAINLVNPETNMPVKINIVDTPGHADFGGEVERVLNMVDGVLLLVDAAEGPKPQTRFVLKKALAMGHRAIVVINKVDRKDADPERVLNETFDLFIELGATDAQAEFPVVYAIATQFKAGLTPDVDNDLQALYQTILKEIPAPEVEIDAPLQMLVTSMDFDPYRGLTAIGRVSAGSIKLGDTVARISTDGKSHKEEIRYLYVMDGLDRVEVQEVTAGDIAAVTGLEEVKIGETLADKDNPVALPTILVEEPTVRMTFGINTSPFAGKEGRWGTSRNLRDRLMNETKSNIALRVTETESADTFVVSGRGELHLGILIETMRREGYEFQVSRPEVIFKQDAEGQLVEPYEEVQIETTADTMGVVIEMAGKRRGEMIHMAETPTSVNLVYQIPTRGLLGFRHMFLTATRGFGVMHSIFSGYGPVLGAIDSRSRGSLVAFEGGTSTTFGLLNAEERGTLFFGPGVEVYPGMVVGEHQRPGDLEVNVAKGKHLNNMRSANRDIDVRLSPPRQLSLDECIEYLSDDELLEVTPESLRIRKRVLDHNMRNREVKRKKEQLT